MAVGKRILVRGFVQGVSYRKQAQRVAGRLGLNGWIRNVSDGSVEAVFEGDETDVDGAIAWCAFGPKKGRVEEVIILSTEPGGLYKEFGIRDDLVLPEDAILAA